MPAQKLSGPIQNSFGGYPTIGGTVDGVGDGVAIDAAAIVNGIIPIPAGGGGSANQLPTAAELATVAGAKAGDTIGFTVINSGTGNITLGTNTGLTLSGLMIVIPNTAGKFRVTYTTSSAATVERVG